MPSNLVKGPEQERLWRKAKVQVHKQYPNVKESSNRFWALVTGLYLKMRGKR